MKALFSELDGTTWEREVPEFMLLPEIRFPVYPSTLQWLIKPPHDTVVEALGPMPIRRYRLIGVSDGKMAFYDRVLDAEEIR